MPETPPPAPFSWDRDPLSESLRDPDTGGDRDANAARPTADRDQTAGNPDERGTTAGNAITDALPPASGERLPPSRDQVLADEDRADSRDVSREGASEGRSAVPGADREHSERGFTDRRGHDSAPRRRGVGIAAVILGSISLLLAVIPLINYLAIVTALLGVILGGVALKRKRRTRGLGIAGLITSIVALVLSVVLAITYTVYVVGFLQTAGLLPGGDAIVIDEPAIPGSLQDPVLVGTRVAFAGPDGLPKWEITPGSPTLDATPILTAAPYSNPPPPAGFQYAVLPLTITYVGTATGSSSDVFVRFLTPDGTAYAAGDLVVVIPEPLIAVGDLGPGASGTGYVAVLVPTEAIPTGAWEVSTGSSPGFYFRSE